jgi:hypothetical protein
MPAIYRREGPLCKSSKMRLVKPIFHFEQTETFFFWFTPRAE